VKHYQPRILRAELNLPIRFFSTDGLITGHCLNISASGMLVLFDRPVAVWMVGELSVLVEEGSNNITIEARVARVDGRQAGLSFYIEDDDNDRLTVGRLMLFAAEHPQPA
jgi:hypothetical protein